MIPRRTLTAHSSERDGGGEQGRAAGIPTPVNSATVETVKSIEAGLLSPDRSNIERVLEAAGA